MTTAEGIARGARAGTIEEVSALVLAAAMMPVVIGLEILARLVGGPMGPDSLVVVVGMTLAFSGFIAWVIMLRRQIAEAR
ncbi:MAG TPA: hypothetical protein VF115_07990 [Acidimicrobiia bacterium]